MDLATRRRLSGDMALLASGERAAFDRVYAVLWPALRAWTARLVPSPTDAEDVAQEALVKVFARVSSYDPSRDALTWAYAITLFEVRTWRRRQHRRREAPLEAMPGEEASPTSPEDLVTAKQDSALLQAAMADLSEADRREIEAYLAPSGVALDAAQRKRRQRALGRLRGIWRTLNGFHG